MNENEGDFISKSGGLGNAEIIKNYLYECAILNMPLDSAIKSLKAEKYINKPNSRKEISFMSTEEIEECVKNYYRVDVEELYEELLAVAEKRALHRMRDDFINTPKAGASAWGRYYTSTLVNRGRQQMLEGGELILSPNIIRIASMVSKEDTNIYTRKGEVNGDNTNNTK